MMLKVLIFKVGHYCNDFLVKFMCNSNVIRELRQVNETDRQTAVLKYFY